MSMQGMDYFDQKPDLDIKAFYQTRALKLAGPVRTEAAPPPTGSAWALQEKEEEEEE